MTLSSGDRFSGKLSLHGRNNNIGSVNVDGETISVGPVICEEDERVQLQYLGTRKAGNTSSTYAICLSNHAIDQKEYNEYLDQIIDLLTPNGPPEPGTETYVKIVEVSEDGIGYASPGGQRIGLGPVAAREGDFVQVVGVSPTHARVVDEQLQGENYNTRFWILSEQYDKLPIQLDDEYTSAIAEYDGETPICYVKNIPIVVPDCDGQIGQKLDVRVTTFEDGHIFGEVIELYDEVSRIKNPGHWARMQWLQDAGFEEPTFLRVVSEYIGVPIDQLPEDPDQLKAALISEAIRLCLANKAVESTDAYPRAHITGIRHWVTHKLEPILGESDGDDGWFRQYLDGKNGPNLSFLGDVLKLSNGYYAAGATRAVLIGREIAILISGVPTAEFLDAGLDVKLRGSSRIIHSTSESELQSLGIAVQSREEYTTDEVGTYDTEFLAEFIDSRQSREWQGGNDWEAYGGESGYGWTWRDTPLEVEDTKHRLVSLWRESIKYGGDEYYLRVENDDTFSEIRIPHQYFKQLCLIIDSLSGSPRTVEISPLPDTSTLHLALSFSPPRSQYRWLTAVGSEWREFANNRIHWEVPYGAVDSVIQVFEQLPVEINDDRPN